MMRIGHRFFTVLFATAFVAVYVSAAIDWTNGWLILNRWRMVPPFLLPILGGVIGAAIDKRIARMDAREEADETFRQMQEVLGRSSVAALRGYLFASELERVSMVS